MSGRVAAIGTVKVNAIIFSSVVRAGDAGELLPCANVYAVRTELPLIDRPDAFADRVFHKPLPVPPDEDEPVCMNVVNRDPFIRVGAIRVVGAGASAVVQFGNAGRVDSVARTKNIRILRGQV